MRMPYQSIDFTMTPAFVYENRIITETCERLRMVLGSRRCKVLFALKSFAIGDGLRCIASTVDGFAASSLFEAQLAREVLAKRGMVHITMPGFNMREIGAIANICDYVSFNSLSQWDRLKGQMSSKVKAGLRVNPQLSYVEDDRYNPCRKYSKLGIPLNCLVDVIEREPRCIEGVTGLHFHSNCDSTDLHELLDTVKKLDGHISHLLERIEWINLGGGYIYDQITNDSPFHEAVGLLHSKYDVDVFIEPGAS